MYTIHNKAKFVVVERLITTLKNKTYKYMSSTSQNVYIDKLDDIVNKYNNTYHRAINPNKDGLLRVVCDIICYKLKSLFLCNKVMSKNLKN